MTEALGLSAENRALIERVGKPYGFARAWATHRDKAPELNALLDAARSEARPQQEAVAWIKSADTLAREVVDYLVDREPDEDDLAYIVELANAYRQLRWSKDDNDWKPVTAATPLPVGSGLEAIIARLEDTSSGESGTGLSMICHKAAADLIALASPLILGGGEESQGVMASQGNLPSPSADTGAETDVLDWLSGETNLSLEYGYPDELDQGVWQVHRVSGGINDREWDLIAQGDDAALALYAARAALSPPEGAK